MARFAVEVSYQNRHHYVTGRAQMATSLRDAKHWRTFAGAERAARKRVQPGVQVCVVRYSLEYAGEVVRVDESTPIQNRE